MSDAALPPPAVCVVGCASWDTLLPIDRYPAEGEYCVVAREIEQPGGTSTNFAVALARLGLPPQFVGMVGDDWRGAELRKGLEAAGVRCDTLRVREGQESDRSLITISPGGGRTIFWIKGAMLRRGDAVDTDRVFAHRLVYLDLVDLDLWGDLLTAYERDHAPKNAPTLVGQAVYVAGILPPAQAMAHVARHTVFIGGAWEWRLLTGETDDAAMLAAIRTAMGKNPRITVAVVTRGADGCTVIEPETISHVPAFAVDVADTTGAGDAFAAGFAYGLTQRWGISRIARIALFANAVGALATRGVGAQASLPTQNEVDALLRP